MSESDDKLTHVDGAGRARMVDVGDKKTTQRRAVAEGRVRISDELAAAISSNSVAKGNLLDVARLAGIAGAKRTDELIPLCHTLPLEHIDVEAKMHEGCVYLRAEARTASKTGVEMEALVAVSVAAMTVIDMGKAIDPTMVVENVRVVEKAGGRRGDVRPHASEFPK